MPLLPARWTCKMCGAEKKEEPNHWFGIFNARSKSAYISFVPFEQGADYSDAVCGKKCALEALAITLKELCFEALRVATKPVPKAELGGKGLFCFRASEKLDDDFKPLLWCVECKQYRSDGKFCWFCGTRLMRPPDGPYCECDFVPGSLRIAFDDPFCRGCGKKRDVHK